MEPQFIGYRLECDGFWYTWWVLREERHMTFGAALWVMWVGWNHYRHGQKARKKLGILA